MCKEIPLATARKDAYLRFYDASAKFQFRIERAFNTTQRAADQKDKPVRQQAAQQSTLQPGWDKAAETRINDQWPEVLKQIQDFGVEGDQMPKNPADVVNLLGQFIERIGPDVLKHCEDSGIPNDQIPKFADDLINIMGQLREDVSSDVKARIRELMAKEAFKYPRIQRDEKAISVEDFRTTYDYLQPGESDVEAKVITIRGRMHSIRTSGSKLAFIDVAQNAHRVQGLFQFGKLSKNGVTAEEMKEFPSLMRRGDIVCKSGYPSFCSDLCSFLTAMTGIAHRSQRGELSLMASEKPILLSASLATLPTTLTDKSTRTRNRHTDLLVNQVSADTLRLRSDIIQYLREFLISDRFTEVQTPIITNGAGGAIARPFATKATEFMDRDLTLRIAPELWLKRLILGGMDRVFEIGPAFRNEGLDATHNPEYTTCEFYKAFAELEELISMTETFMSGLAIHSEHLLSTRYKSLPKIDPSKFSTPFQRLEFVPTLEAALGFKLPDLQKEDATKKLIAIFEEKSISLPLPTTLPRLLDKLGSVYIEPSCTAPTFITHHPACMAPLSKSFICPKTSQLVSARAELFIESREYVNLYEEENSPIEQRSKMLEQLKYKDIDPENASGVDESYLQALEWGLPPTGGWGCGVDRLVMLFSGSARIGDVLSFGTLKNVIGLGGRREG